MARVAYSGTRRPKPDADPRLLAVFELIEEDVIDDVRRLPAGTVVVHGDEPTGVDRIARDIAVELGLPVEAHPPDLAAHGGDFAAAARARNGYVATVGDEGEARFFASPSSKGTWDAVRKAEAAGVRRCVRNYLLDGGVRVYHHPAVDPPRLRVKSGNLRGYAGPGLLDITRGSGKGAGLAFAPTDAILRPALAERQRAQPLFQRANRLVTRVTVTDQQRAEATRLRDEAEAIEAAAWEVYAPLYVAELRVSYGMAREKWGPFERDAYDRGVRPRPDAWKALLAGKLGSYDRDGAPLVVLGCWCGASNVERGRCHTALLRAVLTKLGAEDGGVAKSQARVHVSRR